jgi:peroxiredoxin
MYAIDFGSTMAVNVGSALQAYSDFEFTLSHALALVVVLIFYKVKLASSCSPDAESASLLHSDNLQQHRDHHRHPQKQRPRTASSDTEDESLLSISTDDDDSKSVVFEEEDFELEQLVPEATAAERLRFLVAKKGNVRTAAKAFKAYLQWRSDHQHTEKHGEPALLDMQLYTDDHDWNDWNIAAAAACKAKEETCRTPLPRIARLHKIDGNEIRDRGGFRALHIIPGQMDDRLVSLTTYATAVALYIDRKLARESPDKVSVLIDVRGGVGWQNTHVSKLLPFIQTTTKLLITMFPERLQRAVVYPLPPAFGWIWSVSKRCMDPLTADKICLLTGPATIESPPPISQMIEYLDEAIVALLEKARVAAFVTSSLEESLQQS